MCSYAAIFKHSKDELGFCYYLIPCGKNKDQGQLGAVTVHRCWGVGGLGCCRDVGRARFGAEAGRGGHGVLLVGS